MTPAPALRLKVVRSLLTTVTLLLAACQTGSQGIGGSSEAPAPLNTAGAGGQATEIGEPSTLDGIYTPAQAQRGRQVFENICSTCHQTEDWQDAMFLARWEGESVFRFWWFIYERMPYGEPPYSLPREQVSDIVTYILQLNGLPPGDAELGSDDESIGVHWLHWGSQSQ